MPFITESELPNYNAYHFFPGEIPGNLVKAMLLDLFGADSGLDLANKYLLYGELITIVAETDYQESAILEWLLKLGKSYLYMSQAEMAALIDAKCDGYLEERMRQTITRLSFTQP